MQSDEGDKWKGSPRVCIGVTFPQGYTSCIILHRFLPDATELPAHNKIAIFRLASDSIDGPG